MHIYAFIFGQNRQARPVLKNRRTTTRTEQYKSSSAHMPMRNGSKGNKATFYTCVGA